MSGLPAHVMAVLNSYVCMMLRAADKATPPALFTIIDLPDGFIIRFLDSDGAVYDQEYVILGIGRGR